jgi:hypothetical protein
MDCSYCKLQHNHRSAPTMLRCGTCGGSGCDGTGKDCAELNVRISLHLAYYGVPNVKDILKDCLEVSI